MRYRGSHLNKLLCRGNSARVHIYAGFLSGMKRASDSENRVAGPLNVLLMIAFHCGQKIWLQRTALEWRWASPNDMQLVEVHMFLFWE